VRSLNAKITSIYCHFPNGLSFNFYFTEYANC
jgi:hypothetical protein